MILFIVLAIELQGHPDFKVREAATASLRETAWAAPIIRQAAKTHPDLEVRRRCEELSKEWPTYRRAFFSGGGPREGEWHDVRTTGNFELPPQVEFVTEWKSTNSRMFQKTSLYVLDEIRDEGLRRHYRSSHYYLHKYSSETTLKNP
jgi:hypothetical protein